MLFCGLFPFLSQFAVYFHVTLYLFETNTSLLSGRAEKSLKGNKANNERRLFVYTCKTSAEPKKTTERANWNGVDRSGLNIYDEMRNKPAVQASRV